MPEADDEAGRLRAHGAADTAPAGGTALRSPAVPAVARIELLRVSVPLLVPHRSARSSQTSRESVLVRLTDAHGNSGLGECPALEGGGYVTEPIERAWTVLCTELAPALLAGRGTFVAGAPAATAAMADASLDLALVASGVPLATWLSGAGTGRGATSTGRGSVRWCSVLADTGLGVAEVLSRARVALDRGASMLKVKFDDPDRLAAQIRALRDEFGVPVAADANGSLSAADAHAVDSLGLTYLEQPLPPGTTYEQMASLARNMTTPVALDESLTSLDSLVDAIAAGAVEVASVKPARIGGLVRAANAVGLCSRHGVRAFVGGMFELGVGRAAGVSLASLSGFSDPTDLGPSSAYFESDVVDPIEPDGTGRLPVPGGVGIGRSLIGDRVGALTVDRLVLDA